MGSPLPLRPLKVLLLQHQSLLTSGTSLVAPWLALGQQWPRLCCRMCYSFWLSSWEVSQVTLGGPGTISGTAPFALCSLIGSLRSMLYIWAFLGMLKVSSAFPWDEPVLAREKYLPAQVLILIQTLSNWTALKQGAWFHVTSWKGPPGLGHLFQAELTPDTSRERELQHRAEAWGAQVSPPSGTLEPDLGSLFSNQHGPYMNHTEPSVLPVSSEEGSKHQGTSGLPAGPSVFWYSQCRPFCPALPGVIPRHWDFSQELD